MPTPARSSPRWTPPRSWPRKAGEPPKRRRPQRLGGNRHQRERHLRRYGGAGRKRVGPHEDGGSQRRVGDDHRAAKAEKRHQQRGQHHDQHGRRYFDTRAGPCQRHERLRRRPDPHQRAGRRNGNPCRAAARSSLRIRPRISSTRPATPSLSPSPRRSALPCPATPATRRRSRRRRGSCKCAATPTDRCRTRTRTSRRCRRLWRKEG